MKTAKWISAAISALALTSPPADAASRAEGNAGIKTVARLCVAGETAELSCRIKDNRLVAVCASDKGVLRLVVRQTGKADITQPKDPGREAVTTGWVSYSGGGGPMPTSRPASWIMWPIRVWAVVGNRPACPKSMPTLSSPRSWSPSWAAVISHLAKDIWAIPRLWRQVPIDHRWRRE